MRQWRILLVLLLMLINYRCSHCSSVPRNAKLVGLPPAVMSSEQRETRVRGESKLDLLAAATARRDLHRNLPMAEKDAEDAAIKDAESKVALFEKLDTATVASEEATAAKTILMSEVTKMMQDADVVKPQSVRGYNKDFQEYRVLDGATRALEHKAWKAKSKKQQRLYVLAARMLKQWDLAEEKKLRKATAALQSERKITKELKGEHEKIDLEQANIETLRNSQEREQNAERRHQTGVASAKSSWFQTGASILGGIINTTESLLSQNSMQAQDINKKLKLEKQLAGIVVKLDQKQILRQEASMGRHEAADTSFDTAEKVALAKDKREKSLDLDLEKSAAIKEGALAKKMAVRIKVEQQHKEEDLAEDAEKEAAAAQAEIKAALAKEHVAEATAQAMERKAAAYALELEHDQHQTASTGGNALVQLNEQNIEALTVKYGQAKQKYHSAAALISTLESEGRAVFKKSADAKAAFTAEVGRRNPAKLEQLGKQKMAVLAEEIKLAHRIAQNALAEHTAAAYIGQLQYVSVSTWKNGTSQAKWQARALQAEATQTMATNAIAKNAAEELATRRQLNQQMLLLDTPRPTNAPTRPPRLPRKSLNEVHPAIRRSKHAQNGGSQHSAVNASPRQRSQPAAAAAAGGTSGAMVMFGIGTWVGGMYLYTAFRGQDGYMPVL
jgi:hypothetical protein